MQNIIFSAQRGLQKKIQKLKPELARKIAAGEVIDRPHAVVRELLDNAIDSGAKNISLEIYSGGIEKIIVSDDGIGLSKEDLALCTQAHATSKIDSEVDLLKLQSMGFRGEALSSISAVSRLKIQSKQAQSKENHGWSLESEVGLEDTIEPSLIHQGTIVESQGIFANFPARRQFLKRPATEGMLCKQVFIEKALPFIDTNFTFSSDGDKKLFFPEVKNYKERFASALSLETSLSLFHEIKAKDTNEKPEWQFKLVIADPSLARSDKKQIHIFVNNRKIDEYSFVQAIEYGCQGYFPNGLKPLAALFLEISPALVDFNIHPAKKEARFKDSKPIHRAIHSNIQAFFRSFSFKAIHSETADTNKNNFHAFESFTKSSEQSPIFEDLNQVLQTNQYEFSKDFSKNAHEKRALPSYSEKAKQDFQNLANPYSNKSENFSRPLRDEIYYQNEIDSHKINQESYQSIKVRQKNKALPFHYFGILDSLFLLVEKENELYIIDQHAAHERILFNEFTEKKAESQNLLIPHRLSSFDEKDDFYLESIQEDLKNQGFEIQKNKDGNWEVLTVHNLWEGSIDELFYEILEKNTNAKDLLRNIAQSYACKKAIKDGSYIDDETAIQLIEKAFALDNPHCPHGRPIWTIISKEELFKRVKRS